MNFTSMFPRWKAEIPSSCTFFITRHSGAHDWAARHGYRDATLRRCWTRYAPGPGATHMKELIFLSQSGVSVG
jgi:hypothetical protein